MHDVHKPGVVAEFEDADAGRFLVSVSSMPPQRGGFEAAAPAVARGILPRALAAVRVPQPLLAESSRTRVARAFKSLYLIAEGPWAFSGANFGGTA